VDDVALASDRGVGRGSSCSNRRDGLQSVMHDDTGGAAGVVDHYGTFLETATPDHAGHVPQVRRRI
jgi:hypothetical protein